MPSMVPAFASAVPLRAASRANVVSSCASRAPVAVRRRSRAPCMMADDAKEGGFDFDAIARKLAADLSAQGITAPEIPGMSGDAAVVDVAEDGVGALEVTVGEGDLPKIILRHKQSNQSAEIYTYGANVTSWKSRGQECLWMSEENKWELGGKAIRGGIPICFVSFGFWQSFLFGAWGLEAVY